MSTMRNQVNTGLIERLTEQEKTILALMSNGCSNGVIAEHLKLKIPSVKRYIVIIYEKLDMEDVPMPSKRALAISIYDRIQAQEG